MPLSAKTRQEMEEGARQLAVHAGADKLQRTSRNERVQKASDTSPGVLVVEQPPSDPAVALPADVQATIARGQAAFERQKCHQNHRVPNDGGRTSTVITSVVDQIIQDHRDANLDARMQPMGARRRQPPMIDRLRAVMILVDRLMADGVPFGVGPNSKMNKAVHNWLNEKAKVSTDYRPSRRKEITPTAVRALLKQVRAEGRSVNQGKARHRPTTQQVARELLQQYRERRASGTD